jgi:polar amino acid transport system substrate-binding protein
MERNMKKYYYLPVVIILACLQPGFCEEKMFFLTGGISPPLVYEKNGQVIGMDVDTVTEFCRNQKITQEFKAYPLKRALEMMKEGEAHGIFTIFRSPEREEFMQFPDTPINTVKTIIIGLQGSDIKIKSMDDLRHIRLGVIEGHKYGPLFDQYEGLNKHPVRNKEILIRLLTAGNRVDAIINSEAVFEYECKEFGYDLKLFKYLYTVAENQVFIGFSKKALGDAHAAELAHRFGNFMQKINKDGTLKKIREKY